jgi:tetratricopeptide (TPR) repeat protein
MCRKLLFPASALIGIAMLLFAASNAVAHGSGGHGGGGFGGGFHGGSFGGGGYHGSMSAGGGRAFSGYYGGNVGHSYAGSSEPRFTPGGAMSVNRFGDGALARIPQAQWRHTQAWNDWGHGQAWYRGHEFDRDREHFDHRFAFAPFFFPGWYDWYGWPDYYDYGYDTYWPSYYSDTEPYGTAASYAAPTGPSTEPAVVQDATSPVEQDASAGEQYAEQAREAFRNGDYHDALRLAGHAAVEMPRDAAVHELMSLALFALKDYRGAALEAHAALAIGPPVDWPTLYSYYDNVETYTTQLRTLETFVRDNPKRPEGHFLLGYQYIMIGGKDAAKKELAEAVAITPADKLAKHLMEHLNQV